MGKDLKGRELGKGLTQLGDGHYLARFVDKYGKRQTKHFKRKEEARKWLEDSIYIDGHSNISMPNNMLVDSFFEFWIDTKRKMLNKNTADTYEVRYKKSIQPVIGNMKMVDVKANHCQLIINQMIDAGYGHETIGIARSVLNGIFDYATECDIIMKSPCKIHLKYSAGKTKKKRDALTIEEQKEFLKAIKGHLHENAFRFVLQTGLRVGELCSIKWSNINFEKKTITVNSSMRFLYGKGEWRIGAPKSKSGNRTIPLTNEAIEILKSQKAKNGSLSVIPLEWRDYVFLSKDGLPVTGDTYFAALRKLCKKFDLKLISMHNLRHTFATRCIEAGMMPKTLQTIMGHSTIAVTMDLYVHTTDNELFSAMDMVANALRAI